jgi:SAM-dependent MidA family methyltransferase
MHIKTMQRLDDFMAEALTAYYHNRDPLGVEGDFTTAPEISQLFGEIIGIWAVQQWMAMGMPKSFNLTELGPGRGTLMSDLLRGTKHISDFHDSMAIHLVETSPTLQDEQKRALNDYKVKWHRHLSDIQRNLPSIIIANEFFDALPIQQFQYSNGRWAEHFIDNGQSVWQTTFDVPLKPTLSKACEGDIFEYSVMQHQYLNLLCSYKGAFLLIDYGYTQSAYGDTLQALHKHAPCSITDHIGDADLTSHVDFEWFNTFFKTTSIKTQRAFLKENGIDIRFQNLANKKLASGYKRLLAHDQMGDLFKVLEVQNF